MNSHLWHSTLLAFVSRVWIQGKLVLGSSWRNTSFLCVFTHTHIYVCVCVCVCFLFVDLMLIVLHQICTYMCVFSEGITFHLLLLPQTSYASPRNYAFHSIFAEQISCLANSNFYQIWFSKNFKFKFMFLDSRSWFHNVKWNLHCKHFLTEIVLYNSFSQILTLCHLTIALVFLFAWMHSGHSW